MPDKVIAYIIRDESLVVFIHDDDTNPILESGLQVPAGTVEDGEQPAVAVLREAFEETGLIGLRIVRYLGRDEVRWPGSPSHVRHFFHLTVDDAPVEWRHIEDNAGTASPKPLRLFWLPFAKATLLAAGQGLFVAQVEAKAHTRQ